MQINNIKTAFEILKTNVWSQSAWKGGSREFPHCQGHRVIKTHGGQSRLKYQGRGLPSRIINNFVYPRSAHAPRCQCIYTRALSWSGQNTRRIAMDKTCRILVLLVLLSSGVVSDFNIGGARIDLLNERGKKRNAN